MFIFLFSFFRLKNLQMVRNKQLLDYLLWMFQIFFFFTTYCSARYSVNNRIQRLHNKYFILGNSTFSKKGRMLHALQQNLHSFPSFRRNEFCTEKEIFILFRGSVLSFQKGNFPYFLPFSPMCISHFIIWIIPFSPMCISVFYCLTLTESSVCLRQTYTAIFPFQQRSHIFAVHNYSYTHS